MTANKTALVVGASGLIGRNLVFELLKSEYYKKVIVLSRRDLVIKHNKMEQHLVDLESLHTIESDIHADDIYCCLGSTRAKTPNQDDYRRIDFDYPLEVARIGLKHGAQNFALVSTLGANISSTNFYLKLKGEVEDALGALGFKGIYFFRPSLLLGYRNESRPIETITQYLMRVLNPFFLGPLKMYKAVPGTVVAKAMIKVTTSAEQGIHIIENDRIHELGKS